MNRIMESISFEQNYLQKFQYPHADIERTNTDSERTESHCHPEPAAKDLCPAQCPHLSNRSSFYTLNHIRTAMWSSRDEHFRPNDMRLSE